MTFCKQYIILLCFLCFSEVSVAKLSKDTVSVKNKLELTFFDEKQFFSDIDWGTLHCEYQILSSYLKDSVQIFVQIENQTLESIETKAAIKESLNFICASFTGYTYDVYKKESEQEVMYTIVFNLTETLELNPKLSFFMKQNKIYKIYYY